MSTRSCKSSSQKDKTSSYKNPPSGRRNQLNQSIATAVPFEQFELAGDLRLHISRIVIRRCKQRSGKVSNMHDCVHATAPLSRPEPHRRSSSEVRR
jgi:hypothetical protein